MVWSLILSADGLSVNLNDGVNYVLARNGWVPPIPRKNHGDFGLPALPVVEEIYFNVYSTVSGKDVLAKITAVSILMDMAEEWRENPLELPPVLFDVIGGQTQTSLVLGRAGQEPVTNLPVTFNERIGRFTAGPVGIKFKRKPFLLGDEQSAFAGYYQQPAVMSVNMPSALSIPGPTAVTLAGFPPGTSLIEDAYLLLTEDMGESQKGGLNLNLYTAADMTSSGFSSVDDAANMALGDDVLRIDASVNQSGSIEVADAKVGSKRIETFVALRNNSATNYWRVRVVSTGFGEIEGKWIDIGVSSQEPQILSLGLLVTSTAEHTSVRLDFETDQSVGTLDVNYLAVFPVKRNSAVIKIMEGAYVADPEVAQDIVLDDKTHTDLEPSLVVKNASSTKFGIVIDRTGQSNLLIETTDNVTTAWFNDQANVEFVVPSNLSTQEPGSLAGRRINTLLSEPEKITSIQLFAAYITDFINLGAVENLESMTLLLASITEIDLNGLTKLDELNLWSCASLETLRFGYHPELITLSVPNTAVLEINVGGLVNATSITFASGSLNDVSGLGTLTLIQSLNFSTNGMSEAEVDAIIDQIYAARADYTYGSVPTLNITNNTAPSGTYQYAASPSSGKEKIYALENDDDSEGFETWSISYDTQGGKA